MSHALPLVSVVIPVRNEAGSLADCVRAIAEQDYPLDRIQVLIVDGASTDRTVEVACEVMESYPQIAAVFLKSDTGTISANLNAGLAAARGEILCRVDAKSRIPSHYVRRCVNDLCADTERVAVGGVPIAQAGDRGTIGRAIARAYNNRWATGLSRYKRARRSGPSDTVYLGAFKVSQLRAVDGWDERLMLAEDFDLNRRLGRLGTVWFDAELRVAYVHGSASLLDLFRRQRRLGQAKMRYWRLTRELPAPRQWVVLVAPALALITGAQALSRPRRGRRLAIAGATGLGVLLAVEVTGAREPPVAPIGHLVGAAASAVAAAGYLVGFGAGLLGSRPRS